MTPRTPGRVEADGVARDAAVSQPRGRTAARDPNLANGLVAEELDSDLDGAIKAYRASVADFDARRSDAAHAIFRLAECYRKQGRLAEAKPFYARVVREFSDFVPLAELSQKRLDGQLGRGPQPNQGLQEPAEMEKPAGTGERWERRASAPLRGRHGHTAVWTGYEYIAFGGQGPGMAYGDGASYDPAKNQWTMLPPEKNSELGRTQHTAVWTGQEMIIWGGYGGRFDTEAVSYDNGARFDPSIRSWQDVAKEGAPSPRFDHTAVWTGKEMLIWGGYPDVRAAEAGGVMAAHLDDGARYEPASDTWKSMSKQGAPSPRYNHSAVWTGKQMIIWGGANSTEALNDGAIYDPAEDSWTPLPQEGAPEPRLYQDAIWTGSEMIVFGGRNRQMTASPKDAAAFDPAKGSWRRIASFPFRSCAIWNGRELMVWGGEAEPRTMNFLKTGSRYQVAQDTWLPMTTAGAPTGRAMATRCAAWIDQGMLFFGGWNGQLFNDTWLYRPPQPGGPDKPLDH